MINFTKLTFQNVLSNGKKPTTIDFTNGTTTLIVGGNGSGKSQIYEALFFGLYGKPFRKIKKDQLINSINKRDLKVTIEFTNGKNHIKILRGIKPNLFKIWVDGKLKETEAAIKDQQAYFLSQLLQISENTFRQIVILGSTSYIPFMLLSSHIRRTVIEDLLDLKIFSTMLTIARSHLNIRKRDLDECERKVKEKLISLKYKKTQIAELLEAIQAEQSDLDGELEKIDNKISQHLVSKGYLSDRLLALNFVEISEAKKADQKNTLKVVEVKAKLESKLKNINKELKFFSNNDECPSCMQSIESHWKEDKIVDGESKKEKIVESREKLTHYSDSINARISAVNIKIQEYTDLSKEINSMTMDLEHLNTTKASLQKRIDSFKVGANNTALDSLNVEFKDLKTNLNSNKTEGRELLIETKNYNVIVDLLKDTGIKAQIISTYLPVINTLIQKFMDILEFPLAFTFDNEFNEIIKSRGRDELSYGNFSAGEKLRIDLALLFTWRELTKIKNSAYCNLIILDEIGDSSLDAAGLFGFNRILNTNRKEQCAIIISHNSENMKGVDRTITVEKKGNFSVYNMEK
ncbi:MAG: AAA family ATPase [Candidatus Izemoplasma sp.]